MIPSISQVCSLGSSFAEDLAQLDLPGIEVWLTKLETFVGEHGLAEAQRAVERYGGRLVAASYQGGLWQESSSRRVEAWEHLRRRLELCRALQIPLLVVAADVTGQASAERVAAWQSELRRAGALAQAYGVRLAIEFQARAPFANNLLSLAAILAPLQHPALGICLDAFHFYVGPSQTEDLGRCPPELLTHVQLCDLVQRPRELATDGDRVLPGDGDIYLAPILNHLRDMGYSGAVSVETLSPVLGQIAPASLGDAARAALEKLGVRGEV